MSISKKINNGYHAQTQLVTRREIAAQPLPEEINVPDQVPKEVYKHMEEKNTIQEETYENQEANNTEEYSSNSSSTSQEDTQDDDTEYLNSESDDTQSDDTQSANTQSANKKGVNTQGVNTQGVNTQGVKPSAKESFKYIKDAKEKAERERDLIFQQMMDYQKHQNNSRNPKEPEEQPVDDDIDFNINEDDLVEGRYVKKVTNRIKSLEKQLKNYESQSKQTSVESKIRQEFPDFEKVVSDENVAILNSQFPQIARTLRDTSDMYSKASAAYAIMKKFGIYRDDIHRDNRVKAMANTQKPRPLTSVNPQQGDTPLSKANAFANGLTEELKSQLLREMSAARRAM